MTLRIHSDASYLSELHAGSCTGDHFFLVSQIFNDTSKPNGEILTIFNIMKNVMSSAVEAEVGNLFLMPKQGNQSESPLKNGPPTTVKDHSDRQLNRIVYCK